MLNLYLNHYLTSNPQGRNSAESHAIEEARQLYSQAVGRRWRAQIWAWLTGRSRRLLDLAAVEANGQVVSRHYPELKTVPVGHIRGSASKGRGQDFDLDFYPSQAHDEDRWKSVAAAWLYGQALPPIEVIQVGETYYVQDGHHRVSIARALGQQDIDAIVTVWQVAEAPSAAAYAQPGDCLAPA